MKTIPYRYRNWTYDEQAAASFLYPKMGFNATVYGGILIVSLCLGLGYVLPKPAIVTMSAWIAACFIVAIVASHKARTATIICTRCKQKMKYEEADYPTDALPNYLSKVTRGDNNRVYCYHGEQGWVRIMQGVRICDTCRRFVISHNMIYKPVADVESYESGLRKTEQLINQLQNPKEERRLASLHGE